MHEYPSGSSHPIGATVHPDGTNFSLFSKNAIGVELLLFDHVDDARPVRTVRLKRRTHQTFHYWHIFVPGVRAGQLYAYRVYGRHAPEEGLRFDPRKILLDPYGRAVAMPQDYSRVKATLQGVDNCASAMKSVVADPKAYDWEGDRPLERPFSETIIYEMHVKGFTQHESSGIDPARRGTYRGVIDKIPYLQDLGVTAVELLPVFHFDATEAPEGLTNYWGYSPISFFAPHAGYAQDGGDHLAALDEFRDMVKALHRAGIEVILDVVYNHTAESDENGPMLCFRGIENQDYYILEDDRRRYKNYSGCGNTLNANHSTVRRLIMDSLRYWVREMHVDGFRFDLASILSRDENGHPLANPPILWDIESDPVLAGAKLIAEAWDAAGLYQVGHFVGDHWKEWNGKFRDDVRSFTRGDPGAVSKLASRFLGSPDLYGHGNREPEKSINFVTCHDGFTMNDLVSYNHKRNLANQEDNRDGENHNLSWNCGAEGPTNDPEVEALRVRQIKNLFTINMMSLGVPMLTMGDEIRRTQQGNNNPYCQDNEIGWLDWRNFDRHQEVHWFVKELIKIRLSIDVFSKDYELSLLEQLHAAEIHWHGVKLHQPDWGSESRSIAVSVKALTEAFFVVFNAYWEPLAFEIPPAPVGPTPHWRRVVDTALKPPLDAISDGSGPAIIAPTYLVQPRSIIVLTKTVSP